MTINYKITIEYLGKGFVGWQIQKNGKSIQAIIETALSKVLKNKIRINGSGRTDTGVNAEAQCANFLYKKKIQNKFKFLSSVNHFLNKYPISITNLEVKKSNFHARHSAKKRLYEYIISNRESKLAIDKDRAWLVKKKLEFKKIKKAIKYFKGKHDFSAFRSSSCSAKSPIRKISMISVKKKKDKIIFLIESKSFQKPSKNLL